MSFYPYHLPFRGTYFSLVVSHNVLAHFIHVEHVVLWKSEETIFLIVIALRKNRCPNADSAAIGLLLRVSIRGQGHVASSVKL